MKWLNKDARRRSFDEGVRILSRSGYKPNVAALLMRKGAQEWTEEKLAFCLRELVQLYYNPNDSRYDGSVEDVDDLNDRSGQTVPMDAADKMVKEIGHGERWRQMPEVVQAVTRAFADAFRQRSKLNRQRAALGEGNEPGVKEERARLSREMDSLTEYMDKLWPLRQAWDERGEVPGGVPKMGANRDKTVGKEDKDDKDANEGRQTTEQLKTRRRSIVTQLTRKRNMLRYQRPTSGREENPMPDCPKRVKIERQIAHLTDELTRIEYELARRE